MSSLTAEDVRVVVDQLGGIPYSAGSLVQNSVKKILSDHVERAILAFERGDNLEGAQAVSQTLAVAAAWVGGTAFGWSTKLPLRGLDRVFQSFKDQGFLGKVLERLGVDSPMTRIQIINFTKGMAFGAASAYLVNEFIDACIGRGVNDAFTTAKNYRDPLVLDLDGDGLELIGASSSLLFDHDADGRRVATGWVGSDDGFLVHDLNGDGRITSGRELFGDQTLLSNGRLARDGLEALRDLDSNHDGHFNALDAAWNQVQVWRDLNQNGISDAGELFSLEALGISDLNASALGIQPTNTTIGGNVVTATSTFTRNGVEQTVGQVNFQENVRIHPLRAPQRREASHALLKICLQVLDSSRTLPSDEFSPR